MKVKFLDVVHVTNKLYKGGDIGEFSDLTAEELIKKGLAVPAGDDAVESGVEKPKAETPRKRKTKTNTEQSANEQNGESGESGQDADTDTDAE